jgi:hypothetical protein
VRHRDPGQFRGRRQAHHGPPLPAARGPLRCRPHRVLVRGRWPWPPPAAGTRPGWPAPRGGNRGEAARPPPQPGRRPARCTGRPPPIGPAPAAAGNSPAPRKGRSPTRAQVTGSKSPRTATVATPAAQSTVTITAGTSHTAPALPPPAPNTAWPGPIGGRDARRAGQHARLLRQPFPSNVPPAGIAGPPDLLCRKAACEARDDRHREPGAPPSLGLSWRRPHRAAWPADRSPRRPGHGGVSIQSTVAGPAARRRWPLLIFTPARPVSRPDSPGR